MRLLLLLKLLILLFTYVMTNLQVFTDTPTASASAASSTASSAGSNKSNDDDDGVSTSTIVGLSVAGGVAVLGIVAFFIWKFTRKRFHDLDDSEHYFLCSLCCVAPGGVALPYAVTGLCVAFYPDGHVALYAPFVRVASARADRALGYCLLCAAQLFNPVLVCFTITVC